MSRPVPTQYCSSCGIEYPIGCFDIWSRRYGIRHKSCRACRLRKRAAKIRHEADQVEARAGREWDRQMMVIGRQGVLTE